MIVPNQNTNFIFKSICDGAGCFKEATQTIVEKVGTRGTITLQLCEDCTINFCINSRSAQTRKKEFEQRVEGPTCSNTFMQNQTSQRQQGLPTDDRS